jgi:hypothetical protein
MTIRTRRKRDIVNNLTPTEIAYLSDTDPSPDEEIDTYTLWGYRHGMTSWDGNPHPKDLWKQHGKEFLGAYIEKHPGRRPLPWWQWDGPRQDTGSGAFWEPLPILRHRLGGVGTPKHEVLAYVPQFHKGIPEGWVSKFDEEYYNGRARDVHGNPIGTKYKEGHFKGKAIDPNDPPTFEAEAVYLERHGLLTAAEKKWLAKHPEALEPEKIKLEEGE